MSTQFMEDSRYRIVVQRTKEKDSTPDLFGDRYTYRCIITNDWDSEEKCVIETYNMCLLAFSVPTPGGSTKDDIHVSGIGSLFGGLFAQYPETETKQYLLLCCHQNDRLIYQDKNYSDCYISNTSVDNGQEMQKPYRYADNCFCFDTTAGKIDFTIYDTNGCKRYAASPVQPMQTVDFLPAGIYFCRAEVAGYAHWERFVVTR